MSATLTMVLDLMVDSLKFWAWHGLQDGILEQMRVRNLENVNIRGNWFPFRPEKKKINLMGRSCSGADHS
ncbi:hypothetical protein ACSBL2_21375 [Pedobacter sp. AW31-3R]|uniref:hypothetical protein n=1 Tax=Pedobacter sp. AW31-3R TaxID=3445781 RepID=UPI003FA0FAEC